MRRLSGCFLLFLLGCDRSTPIEARASAAPSALPPRPALPEPGCEAIARETPGAAWQDAGALSGEAMVIADPSILGGPFAPPVEVGPAVARQVRVLVAGEGSKARAHCIQVKSSDDKPASWRTLGQAGVDTGMIVVGDKDALNEALRPSQAAVAPCAEAPAAELARLLPLVKARGLELTSMLPTLACAGREATPADRTLIAGLLREHRIEGRYLLEPRQPAWPMLEALGPRPWAPFAPAGKTLAVVVEVSSGDGLYPVRAGTRATGEPILIEIPLR